MHLCGVMASATSYKSAALSLSSSGHLMQSPISCSAFPTIQSVNGNLVTHISQSALLSQDKGYLLTRLKTKGGRN